MDENSPPFDRRVAFFGGAFFILLSIALAVLGIWAIPESVERYETWLGERAPVLIESTDIAAFYGVAPFLVGMFVYALYGVWIGVVGCRHSWFERHVQKPLAIFLLVGVACIFLGRFAANSYWESQFVSHGYNHCQRDFVMTGRWATRVWASSPSICEDSELKTLLRSTDVPLFEINDFYSPIGSELDGG